MILFSFTLVLPEWNTDQSQNSLIRLGNETRTETLSISRITCVINLGIDKYSINLYFEPFDSKRTLITS